jgi:fructose-1,6-bisphosphatase/inositol monophosphatase family enzyme
VNFDVLDLAAILRDASETEIVPRFRNLAAEEIGNKSHAYDLVTLADTGAERVITEELRARFPAALIVGEEAYAADKSIMSGLAEAELAFVIDPVDGTFNFAAGNGLFGSILAVLRHGETVGGLILDPLRGDALVAERGAGARLLRANGQSSPLRVAAPVPLGEMISVITWSYLAEPLRSQVATRLPQISMSVGYGCSAHEYWMLASGRAHFGGADSMNPWDHLAGVLIHGEAGGYSARFDGSPYHAGVTDGGLICAPDKACWEAICQQIFGSP